MLQVGLSWLILLLQIIPWFVVVAGVIVWFINRQTTNIKWKYLSSLWTLIAIGIIYLVRFTPLVAMSLLETYNSYDGNFSEVVKGGLTIIQFLIVGVIWNFSIIQSTIFFYQWMITEGEKQTSKVQRNFFLYGGLGVTIVAIGILEMLKYMF